MLRTDERQSRRERDCDIIEMGERRMIEGLREGSGPERRACDVMGWIHVGLFATYTY